jgi:lipopolysaccharide biosynthesis protein
MLNQYQIDSELAKFKLWYKHNYPLCIFCGHRVKGGQLAHLIRRSFSRELQAVKLNTGLAHPDCHELFDDHPDQAVYLPRIVEVLYIIWTLDEPYFNMIADNFEELADVMQLFPEVRQQDKLDHHGELLTLQYLHPLRYNIRLIKTRNK